MEAKRDLQKLVESGHIEMDGSDHIKPLKDPYLELERVAAGGRIPYFAIYGVPGTPDAEDLKWVQMLAERMMRRKQPPEFK